MHYGCGLVFLIAFLFTSAGFANCPTVYSVLDEGKIEQVEQLIRDLKACDAPADSVAWTYYNLAKLYYFDGQMDQAIVQAKNALEGYEELYRNDPNPTLGNAYHLVGAFHNFNNTHEDGQAFLERAVAVRRQTREDKIVQTYLALANNFTARGAFDQAANYFQLMLDKAISIGDADLVVSSLSSYGNLLNEFQRYDAAKSRLEKANEILEDQELSIAHANCWLNLGVSNYHLENYAAARRYYQKAVQLYDQLEDCDYVSLAYSGLGRTLQKMGDNRKAIEVLKNGLQIADICAYPSHAAMLHDNLGECYLENNQPESALASYQLAIRKLLPTFEPENDLQSPDTDLLNKAYNKVDLLVYLSDKARTLEVLSAERKDTELLQHALALYKLGDQLIDRMRQEHRGENTKLFWRSKVLPFYENAIRITVNTKDAETAFYFFEKSKAILLLEALQEADALSTIPDSCKREVKILSNKLYEAQQILEESNADARANALSTLLNAQAELDQYQEKLAQQYRDFDQLKSITKAVDFSVFKENELDDLQSSIHFFYGKNNIYALVVTNADPAEVFDLGETKLVESSIRNFLTFFESSSTIENAPQDYLRVAHQLYKQLLAPLSIDETKELLIFPDGALAYLPFEALVTAPATHLATAPYLLQQYALRYAYSASVLAEQQNPSAATTASVAAYAPFAHAESANTYSALTFTSDELAKIQSLVAGAYRLDEEATLTQFKKDKDQHGIIHLSTHAFSSATGDRPRIAFADTTLHLADLYLMDLPADLVVLSACQTNIGQLSPGEGVLSLGRGFTHAGARSLVSSLWNVNARATGTVLATFYEQLQSGTPKYKALHQAKLSYLENQSLPTYERSPYYWAGIVYYGGKESIALQSVGSIWPYVVAGLILFISLGGFLWYRGG